MRVLITGMGGELGTRVAQLLEERREVTEIVGVDFVPPRRRLRRSEFRRIDPRDRDKLAAFAAEFAPDAVAHFGVYEPALAPAARRSRRRYTRRAAVAALGGAARAGKLTHVVLRSGLAVYGRGRGRPGVPDEDAPVAPTTPFGRSLLAVEALAVDLGRRHGFPVAALRMATIAGSHVPSPLGRVLRLPAVPVPALADPVFQLLHQEDAARAMVAGADLGRRRSAQRRRPGAASVWQAVRLGGRVPLPVVGPDVAVAAQAVELAGAPAPPHVIELLTHGAHRRRLAAVEELGLGELRPHAGGVHRAVRVGARSRPLRPAHPLAEAVTAVAEPSPTLAGLGGGHRPDAATPIVARRRAPPVRRAVPGRSVRRRPAAPGPDRAARHARPCQVRGRPAPSTCPRDGPALLVTNRGLGVLEPTALSVAVRQECGRRLRVVGTTELPVVGDVLRKLGSVGAYPGDLGALLRAGHLAALPLGVTWRRTGGGVPPTELLVAALGYPVIPVRGPTRWTARSAARAVARARRRAARSVRRDRRPAIRSAAAELAEAVREPRSLDLV